MKPRTLKQAIDNGWVKSGHYINNSGYIPDRVRIDMKLGIGLKSFWVTRKYAERLGFKQTY